MTLEYKQSLTEINTILNFMGTDYINKLPNKLLIFIKENMDNSYFCDINVNIPIAQQNIKKDTKILLSILYRNYWCTKEKKIELLEEDAYLKSVYEKEMYKKYNPDNLFNKRNKNSINEGNKVNTVEMIEYKESFIMKLINKFKMIFHIK